MPQIEFDLQSGDENYRSSSLKISYKWWVPLDNNKDTNRYLIKDSAEILEKNWNRSNKNCSPEKKNKTFEEVNGEARKYVNVHRRFFEPLVPCKIVSCDGDLDKSYFDC